MSSAERWAEFSGRWHALVVDEWKLTYFHMADFEARRGEFEDWPRDDESKRRLGLLLELITEYALCLVGVAFPRSLYRDIYTGRNVGHEMAAMYYVSAAMTFMQAGTFAREQKPFQKIAFVYEAGAKGSGHVKDTYERRVPQLVKDNVGFTSLKFGEKAKFEPLQAADILAYETFRHFPKWAGVDSRPTRCPLDVLFRGIPERRWGVISPDDLFEVNRMAGLS